MSEHILRLDPVVEELINSKYEKVLSVKKASKKRIGPKAVDFYELMELDNIIPVECWNSMHEPKEPYWGYIRMLQFRMRKELGENIKRKLPIDIKKKIDNAVTSKPWGSYDASVSKIVRG